MKKSEQTKEAFYNNHRVRAYRVGQRVYIEIDDLDAITGYRKLVNVAGGYIDPELDKAIEDVKASNPEFADWLHDEFGELILTDYSN